MFHRLAAVTSLFLFAACASAPATVERDEKQAAATDACLANPALAKRWGECNVKRVIYDHAKELGACQAQNGAEAKEGDTLMLKIRLRPDGKVRDVRADPSVRSPNRALEACLARTIVRLQFAAPPKGVKPVIYFPYQL